MLYLAATESTLGMVLVQEDDLSQVHIVYYLSRVLACPKYRYSLVEKFSLVAVHVVQWFKHYILSYKTFMVAVSNQMQHIFSRKLIKEKYLKWIVIIQEFDLEFVNAKSNKSLFFAKLVFELPRDEEGTICVISIPN